MSSPPPNPKTVRLRRGRHASPDQGVCVMELASMLAGEPFSDHPSTVSPVVGAVLRAYNDVVDDGLRQDLYAYATRALHTAGSAALERDRADRCVEEIHRLHDDKSRLRRWLSTRPTGALPLSSLELERTGMDLIRALRRARGDSHSRALALIDELIAMGTPTDKASDLPAARQYDETPA